MIWEWCIQYTCVYMCIHVYNPFCGHIGDGLVGLVLSLPHYFVYFLEISVLEVGRRTTHRHSWLCEHPSTAAEKRTLDADSLD